MRAASAVEHSGGMEHKFGSVLSSSCMVWNGDHLFFGSESGELHIWEATTFKEVMRIKGHAGMVLYIAGYHLYITVLVYCRIPLVYYSILQDTACILQCITNYFFQVPLSALMLLLMAVQW